MATINTTTEFVPEIWEQIKEYGGIYSLPANIIHFDKLTSAELEESIDAYEDEVPTPFGYIGINSVYDILYCKEQLECSGGKWFYDGGEVKEDEKKELLVKWLKKYYRDEYGLRQYTYAELLCGKRREGELVENKRQDDIILQFWNEMSEMITYHFKKRDEAKAATKALKETPKGMTQDILDIQKQEVKLVIRMQKDAEKMKKLKEKREKLEAKRREKYGGN